LKGKRPKEFTGEKIEEVDEDEVGDRAS